MFLRTYEAGSKLPANDDGRLVRTRLEGFSRELGDAKIRGCVRRRAR